jgi:hypothetical protein
VDFSSIELVLCHYFFLLKIFTEETIPMRGKPAENDYCHSTYPIKIDDRFGI